MTTQQELNQGNKVNFLASTKNINKIKMNLIKARKGSQKELRILSLLLNTCEAHEACYGVDLWSNYICKLTFKAL